MRAVLCLLAIALVAGTRAEVRVQPRLSLLGFSSARQDAQRAAEMQFKAGVSVDEISAIHRLATRRPHVAGSAASLALADRLRDALTRAGLQTETHDYRVHLSTPRRIAVDIVEPTRERLRAHATISIH